MDENQKQSNENSAEIEELRAKCDEYLNGWKRAKADMTNLQNDMARERERWAKFAASGLLERMLPVLDTLEAAAAHAPELSDVVRKFADALKVEGVAEIKAEGKYDHALHDVIGREKREGIEEDMIVVVAQKGYMLHDKVLRPAKVIIAE
jgi:molecular chaperone GrpE